MSVTISSSINPSEPASIAICPICLNKEYDDKGQQKGDCFVVESLRDEDCFSKSRTAYTVTHFFSAPNDAKKYTNLLFLDENATIDGLPDEIKNMLDQTLLHK